MAIARTLPEALAALAEGSRPIAGGTDLVVGARQGKSALPPDLVAIDRIDELRQIEEVDGGLRIGAAVTFRELLNHPVVGSDFTSLADAAALVGSPATRNIGTLGGNVMNASPAMDSGSPLVTMDATVELASVDGVRTVPVGELWTGPGETTAATNEMCTSVHLPTPPSGAGSAYVRLEYRRAMEIAVVGAAALVSLDTDVVATVSIALTAVAPTIAPLDVADLVVGRPFDDDAKDALASAASESAAPITDLRASDAYRRHCIGVMAVRSVEAAVDRASGRQLSIPVNRSVGVGAR